MDEGATSLLARARSGDEQALSQLLEQTGPQVRRTLQMPERHRSVLDADDIMQVTYVEAFVRFAQFVGLDERSFAAWLRQIAHNNLRDAIRGLEREKRPPANRRVTPLAGDDSYVALADQLGLQSTTPSRVAAAAELKTLLDAALQKLPPAYAEVIRLFDLEGLTGPDVAQRMERSRGGVFMLLARARERLREVLGPDSRYFSHGGS